MTRTFAGCVALAGVGLALYCVTPLEGLPLWIQNAVRFGVILAAGFGLGITSLIMLLVGGLRFDPRDRLVPVIRWTAVAMFGFNFFALVEIRERIGARELLWPPLYLLIVCTIYLISQVLMLRRVLLIRANIKKTEGESIVKTVVQDVTQPPEHTGLEEKT